MQKHLKYIFLIFTVAMSVLLTGCPGGGSSGGSAGGGSPTTPSGGGTINGLVTDFNTGVKLAGVSVTDGTQTVTTDANGKFTLSGYASGASVTVTMDKASYTRGHATADIGVNAAPVVLPLKKEIVARKSYNPTANSTLSFTTEAGPYALILTAGSLNTTDTNLKVSVTPLDPVKESSVLPSGLADSTGSSTVMLVPLTFADFSIFDSSGNRVQLKSGAHATVEMPIPPDLRSKPEYQVDLVTPKIVHCYSYNPATGKWDNFIVGTIVPSSVDGTTPVLRADIIHFSWYGGAPQNTNCVDVYGRVVSAVDGKPLPYARVEAFPGTVATSDANGNFVVTTTVTGANSFTASRTFIDTDGSVSGMAGAKVIEFGKVVDELVGLVTRPCTSTPPTPPIPPTQPPKVTVKIGGVSLLSYQVDAFLVNGAACAILNESIPPNGTKGNAVSGAIMVLTGPTGSVNLTEQSGSAGMYCAVGLTVTPGARYTLTIDADHNGSIDGTGSATAVGTLNWTTPTNGSTQAASGFNNAAWTDSASGYAGYSVTYYASIVNSGGTTSHAASYVGSAMNFKPVDIFSGASKLNLPAGTYTGNLFAFSGPYGGSGGTWDAMANNITGSTVSGKFYSFGSPTSPITFTLN